MLSHVITGWEWWDQLIPVFKILLFLVILRIWFLIFNKWSKNDHSLDNPKSVINSYVLLFLGIILLAIIFSFVDQALYGISI